jgi:hypothetical protein
LRGLNIEVAQVVQASGKLRARIHSNCATRKDVRLPGFLQVRDLISTCLKIKYQQILSEGRLRKILRATEGRISTKKYTRMDINKNARTSEFLRKRD